MSYIPCEFCNGRHLEFRQKMWDALLDEGITPERFIDEDPQGRLDLIRQGFRLSEEDSIIVNLDDDAEIDIVGWEKLGNLMTYPLRAGVENVLKQCLEERVFQKSESLEELVPISIGSLGINKDFPVNNILLF